MILDLHMVVFERHGHVGLAYNRGAIDQRTGLNQRAFDENCVVR